MKWHGLTYLNMVSLCWFGHGDMSGTVSRARSVSGHGICGNTTAFEPSRLPDMLPR